MKILVCGSRNWTNIDPIKQELNAMPAATILVHGAAKGADSIAAGIGATLGMQIRAYHADWDKHGRAAGPIRNAQMLEEEHPDKNGVHIDLVLAFSDDIENSKGTKNMLMLAQKQNIPTKLISNANP